MKNIEDKEIYEKTIADLKSEIEGLESQTTNNMRSINIFSKQRDEAESRLEIAIAALKLAKAVYGDDENIIGSALSEIKTSFTQNKTSSLNKSCYNCGNKFTPGVADNGKCDKCSDKFP